MRFFAWALLCLCSLSAAAQTATIRGTVYDKSTGEAIPLATVFLKDTKFGLSTDLNGFYSLTKIPAGTYTLIVRQQSYRAFTATITVKAGQIFTQNAFLVSDTKTFGEVIIDAEKTARQEDPKISVFSMNKEELSIPPATGGIPDIAQSVQVIPGVVSTGDQGGQLYIRGGAPVQNKVLLDGMIIYNPFHSIGLFSVFDMDVIKNMDVFTGGFGAEYGGRISSVMDITTRDGNKTRMSGKVTASPFGSKLLLEGPIKRRSDSLASVTYVVSAKNSYLRQTSKALYSYAADNGLPFNFNDYYGKISFNNNENGSKLNLFGFMFNDTVTRFQNAIDLGWKSVGMGSNFQVIPGNSTTVIKGNFAYSKYKIGMTEDYFRPRSSGVDGFNLGLNFTYFQRKNIVNYGIEVLGYKTDFTFTNSVNRTISQQESTSEFAAFLRYKWVSDSTRLVLEPGFRLQYYASLNNISLEPRFAFKYNITDVFRLKGSAGVYSQNLISAVSDRDVVNLFYGFVSGPDNLQSTFTDQDGKVHDVTHKLQKANHAIFGGEYDLSENWTLNLEGYLKDFTQLTNLNRNKLYDDTDPANNDKPDLVKKDFIIETGKAYGVDFLSKYDDHKQFYVWAVYSLGYVTRWDGVQEYRPHFDRRHNVNLVGAWKFNIRKDDTASVAMPDGSRAYKPRRAKSWEVNARWNFGSGLPFTPTQGFYENINFGGGLNTDYTTANGDLTLIYGPQNSHQLPAYHRLDITVKKTFVFSKRSKLEVSGGATNVYNRKNVYYVDRVTGVRVNQLPIMPSLAASWTF